MNKILIIILILVTAILSVFIFDDVDIEASTRKVEKKSKVSKVAKENYKYITEDTDNIDGLLNKEEKAEPIIEEVVVNEPINEEENPKKNGFIEEDNKMYYYENDIRVIGEKEIDGYNYFFNEEGVMQRSLFIDKKYYGEDGKQIIGFYDIDNNTYYFENEGYVVGNKEIENDIYYFNEEGILQKDIIIENCYYDGSGKLYTGFKDIDSNTYYFSKEGIVKGIKEIDDKKYYFDEEGHLIRNSFYDNYYLDEDGVIVTGQREINGRIYVFNEEGILQNGFQVIDGNTYFLDENSNKLLGLQLIDGIRYYFDFETGVLMKKDVKSIIDISSWQGDINFDMLKESGLVDGVIVRVGYGTTNNDSPVLDNKFERNISELNRLGIPYGIYIFGYAQTEEAAIIEASFTDEMIKKYSVNLSYPIFYDAELTEFNGVKYTKALYKRVINKYISTLNELGYDNVGVYGNLSMLTSGGLSSLQKKIPKWVAQYYTRCEYDNDYIGWQYTSDGYVPGIEGRVDLNIFY